MDPKAGVQISRKAFMQSLIILALLMLAAGVLTLVIEPGAYDRTLVDGRDVIDPNSYHTVARPAYPAWRWLLAPLEVLGGPDGVTIITIVLFILMVGMAIALLEKSGILNALLGRIVRRFQHRKMLLLMVISFFFMCIGAFFGIFEEVVPLIPVVIGLAYALGWDTLTGLGMSILATNMGFSAAVTNPFSIGLAQKIGGLPLFSGAEYRVAVFLVMYLVLILFLTRYARQVERSPESSPMFTEDQVNRRKFSSFETAGSENPGMQRGMLFFAASLVLILAVFLSAPFVPLISAISLPLVGLLFLIAGIGASLLSGNAGRQAFNHALEGAAGLAPGIPLILMAASVKYIIAQGSIMDTILHSAAAAFNSASPVAAAGEAAAPMLTMVSGASPFLAALLVYAIALLIEFFVGSSSAKVFLLMPILLPLGDLVGLTRQTAITAYCFGDGFTNLIYPTNAVLLISLGLSSVPYGRWLKWTLKLWAWVLPLTLVFLLIAVFLRLGPF
ncbi:MAG TPA: AbgT family transporter [Anaerolineaceae bacterium]|nr:AbgT family transporter [Anaerolineaceae bacterium]HPN50721.1 AbgT family transporter [Anaerolineaceae bacterium]